MKCLRKTEQPASIRDEKKAQIIDAALKLFSEHGYHGTSTSMIARAAGISKGLLYHYIESKEKLIQEICKAVYDLIYQHHEIHDQDVLTPEELEIFVRNSFDAIRENKEFFRLIFSLSMNEEVRKIMQVAGSEIGITNEHALLQKYFETHFEQPQLELSLFLSLTKGATLLYCTEYNFYDDHMLRFAEEEAINRFIIHKKP